MGNLSKMRDNIKERIWHLLNNLNKDFQKEHQEMLTCLRRDLKERFFDEASRNIRWSSKLDESEVGNDLWEFLCRCYFIMYGEELASSLEKMKPYASQPKAALNNNMINRTSPVNNERDPSSGRAHGIYSSSTIQHSIQPAIAHGPQPSVEMPSIYGQATRAGTNYDKYPGQQIYSRNTQHPQQPATEHRPQSRVDVSSIYSQPAHAGSRDSYAGQQIYSASQYKEQPSATHGPQPYLLPSIYVQPASAGVNYDKSPGQQIYSKNTQHLEQPTMHGPQSRVDISSIYRQPERAGIHDSFPGQQLYSRYPSPHMEQPATAHGPQSQVDMSSIYGHPAHTGSSYPGQQIYRRDTVNTTQHSENPAMAHGPHIIHSHPMTTGSYDVYPGRQFYNYNNAQQQVQPAVTHGPQSHEPDYATNYSSGLNVPWSSTFTPSWRGQDI